MLRMCLWKMWTMYRYLLQINESMEDLTDMQNYVLPYLQSFCNLEEKRCEGETRTADSRKK